MFAATARYHSSGGERFTISYTGGTGNDVVLTRQVTPQLVVTTLPATEVPNFALDFDVLLRKRQRVERPPKVVNGRAIRRARRGVPPRAPFGQPRIRRRTLPFGKPPPPTHPSP